MVAQFGMSEKLGPVFYEHRAEHPFLGQRLASDTGVSDLTVHTIEEETKRLLSNALDIAKKIITTHRPQFDRLVAVVVENETVEQAELAQALGPKESPGQGTVAAAMSKPS